MFIPGHHRVRPAAHPRPRRPDLSPRREGESSAASRGRPFRRGPRAVAGVRVRLGGRRSARLRGAAAAARPRLRPQLRLLLDGQDTREHAQEQAEIR